MDISDISESIRNILKQIIADAPNESDEWLGGWFGMALDDATASSRVGRMINQSEFREALYKYF